MPSFRAMALVALASGLNAAESPRPWQPVVEVEQEVYSHKPADNGAGPMWCFGNTCVVRLEQKVFASGIRTLPDCVPLNNVRWMLFQAADEGWKQVADGGETHEREPCPLACFPDGRLLLSVNPNSCKPGEKDGPAQPQVLQFAAADPAGGAKTLVPQWKGEIRFHAHTYRSFAADGARQELVLFYNTAYDKTYWTFLDEKGQWSAQGELAFPWGAEYDKPQPVRVCYPVVQLKDRAVHFCGVSDVVEPYNAWREYKKQLTGREWDYDFRRLFYTWSDDIAGGQFHKWVEIASRDKTCGWLFPCDLWAAPDGRVHVLWSERALDERLRKKFFPDEKQSLALNYAVLRDGQVLLRKPVLQSREGEAGETPGRGRFHVTPGGRLLVFYHAGGKNARSQSVYENRLVEVLPDGSFSPPVTVPLKKPLESFFTATPRAGCKPSVFLDLLGESGSTLRYARIRLEEP